MKFWHKLFFRLRERGSTLIMQSVRKFYWRMQGMQIGINVSLPTILVTWPHQVSIGNDCQFEKGVFLKFDGIWQTGPHILIGDGCFVGAYAEFNIKKQVRLGANCLIASGCKFIDHDHGFASRDLPIGLQSNGSEQAIVLEDDVWLGVNVVVLKGVQIGCGAIIAAGSVVTQSIPQYEIWAGIPARKITERPR